MSIKVGSYYKALLKPEQVPSLILYCVFNNPSRYLTQDGIEIEGMRGKVRRVYEQTDIDAIKNRPNNPFVKSSTAKFPVEIYCEKDSIVYRYNSSQLIAVAFGVPYQDVLTWTAKQLTVEFEGMEYHFKRGWDLQFKCLDAI